MQLGFIYFNTANQWPPLHFLHIVNTPPFQHYLYKNFILAETTGTVLRIYVMVPGKGLGHLTYCIALSLFLALDIKAP